MNLNTDRLTAALADRYRILRPLGAGGMATVYLAEDLKHDRKVALKVLKPELAAVLGAERFVVEIRTTAALQHPHILPLFDSGEADGFLFYVMPFIDGETLRDKLDRETQLGVEDALRIATEVADALDYAHRHGVIHRDIKPENILLQDGRPVVADFGIALAVSAAAGGRMTETGLSLGTPHYMSPEQATAEREITARSDVYSLGSVLYEMLTGQPPHVGGSAQQIIMKIITELPQPVTTHRRTVPPHVAAAVGKALEKLPADRFDSAKAFAEALRDIGFTTALRRQGATAGPTLRDRRFLITAGVAIAVTVLAALGWMRPQPPRPVARFSIPLPDSAALAPGNGAHLSISPDGQTIAWVSAADGERRIWTRRLDQLDGSVLAGTETAYHPAFSPDGTRLAFIAQSDPTSLRVANLDGSGVLVLTDSLVGNAGVAWGEDGYIYYNGQFEGNGIVRVRETGGRPEVVTRRSSEMQRNHTLPTALPSGRGVLYVVNASEQPYSSVWAVDTRTGESHQVTIGRRAYFLPGGHLLTAMESGAISAARFDLDRLESIGEPVLLTRGKALGSGVQMAVSRTGTLFYLDGETPEDRSELVWVTRDGVASAVDSTWTGAFGRSLELSPDGRSVAIVRRDVRGQALYVKRLDAGPATRLTERVNNVRWFPDGQRLIGDNAAGLVIIRADGSRPPEQLEMPGARDAVVTPDGQRLVFVHGAGRVVMRRLTGDTTTTTLFDEGRATGELAVSPDGRWLAYMTFLPEGRRVLVRSFPDGTIRHQVSTADGGFPFWSRDGRELFFVRLGAEIYRVPLRGGDRFEPGTQELLWKRPGASGGEVTLASITPDGRRFLVVRPLASLGELPPDRLVLVQHIDEDLRRLLPP